MKNNKVIIQFLELFDALTFLRDGRSTGNITNLKLEQKQSEYTAFVKFSTDMSKKQIIDMLAKMRYDTNYHHARNLSYNNKDATAELDAALDKVLERQLVY